MKKLFCLCLVLGICIAGYSQTDTVYKYVGYQANSYKLMYLMSSKTHSKIKSSSANPYEPIRVSSLVNVYRENIDGTWVLLKAKVPGVWISSSPLTEETKWLEQALK